jgi:hypothetical protein
VHDGGMPEANTTAEAVGYQLRVVLRGISPLIWRRLLVRSDSTIFDLHRTLQIAFGWSDEHLHRFVIHGREHGAESLVDPRRVHLADLGLRVHERFQYEYDFTDGWQHDVRLEQILLLKAGRACPRCVGGRRRVPPEDCGGPWAFLELRERYSLLTIADRLSALALAHANRYRLAANHIIAKGGPTDTLINPGWGTVRRPPADTTPARPLTICRHTSPPKTTTRRGGEEPPAGVWWSMDFGSRIGLSANPRRRSDAKRTVVVR